MWRRFWDWLTAPWRPRVPVRVPVPRVPAPRNVAKSNVPRAMNAPVAICLSTGLVYGYEQVLLCCACGRDMSAIPGGKRLRCPDCGATRAECRALYVPWKPTP